MSSRKIFANKYIPKYVPEDLSWYEKDGLLTYIDQLKYKDFISDPNAHIKNTQIINFEMIHAQCCGQPLKHSDEYFQTVTQEDVKKCLKRIRKSQLVRVSDLQERTFLLTKK